MNAPFGFENVVKGDLRSRASHPRISIGHPEGVPRSELAVPISPTGALSAEVLYEDAANPATLLYLPSYTLREQGMTYDVVVTALPTGRWAVRIGLDGHPAPALGDAGRSAAPMPFRAAAAALEYTAPPVVRRIEASEIAPDDRGYLLTFDLDLPGKDELLWAIASDGGATVVLARAFDVAVPAGETAAPPVGAFEVIDGNLKLLAAQIVQPPDPTLPRISVPVRILEPVPVEPDPDPERVVVKRVEPTVIETLAVEPRVVEVIAQTVFVESLARTTGILSPAVASSEVLHANTSALAATSLRRLSSPAERVVSRQAPLRLADTHVSSLRDSVMRRRTFDPGLLELVIDPGRIVLTDPAPDVVQLYRVISPSLDADVLLKIDPAVHPAIFGGAATSAPTYTVVRVIHPPTGPGARSHVYFHDVRRPHVFLHLPDEYRLARTESVPLRPALVFRVVQGESERAAVVSMTARLRPEVDPARLHAAAAQLAKLIPPPLPGEEPAVLVLEPVQADATLTLGLPPEAESVAPPLDLVNGFVFEVRLPYASFQDVFAALASEEEVGTLLRGTVAVAVGTDDGPGPTALVPVDMRFATAGGDVLRVDHAPTADGAIALSLRNVSESPVRIDGLPLRIARVGGESVEGVVDGVSFPLELVAGGDIALAVRSASQLPGEGELELLVDLAQVVPLPDAQAILALTLDQSVAQLSARSVTVRTTAGLLAGGGDPIDDVFIEFEGGLGDPPQLNAAQLQAVARIPVPLADVLLRRSSGPYRFRQIVLRASGQQQRDTEWRTSDSTLLIVPEK